MNITQQNNEQQIRNVKVLGIGSSKYKQLTYNLFTVIKELEIDAQIEQYEEVDDFIRFNITAIPTLIIDNQIVAKGRVPNKEELKVFFYS